MKYAEKISCSKKKERKYQLGKTAKVSTHCVAIWVHQLFPKCLEVGPQTTVLAALMPAWKLPGTGATSSGGFWLSAAQIAQLTTKQGLAAFTLFLYVQVYLLLLLSLGNAALLFVLDQLFHFEFWSFFNSVKYLTLSLSLKIQAMFPKKFPTISITLNLRTHALNIKCSWNNK